MKLVPVRTMKEQLEPQQQEVMPGAATSGSLALLCDVPMSKRIQRSNSFGALVDIQE